MTGQTILIADDDPATLALLHQVLQFGGHTVVLASTAAEALDPAHAPTGYIIDLMMPGTSGLDLCRTLRDSGIQAPILILSASHRTSDRVACLDAGADDYLQKPFAVQELLARVRAILRRHHHDNILQFAGLSIDKNSRSVHRDGHQINLTRTEYSLLLMLAENHGRVLTRSELFENIWGYDLAESSNTLDVYIGYLRRKIETPGTPRILHTIRGVGYLLRQP